jgi:hypothetical protein
MATSSLTKLTVPLASDQSSPTQGLLMPKLKYRFRVTFLGLGVTQPTTELTKQVMDFKRPNVTFADIDLPVYNSTIKLAGKYTWDNVTCTIRDDASGSVTTLVGEQLQKQLDFMEQSSAAAGIDYKFTTVFQVLDGGNGASAPIALEEWNLLGCYLQGVDYGNGDYSSNEVMTLALTIRFDNALQTIGGGVGTPSPVEGQRNPGAATG